MGSDQSSGRLWTVIARGDVNTDHVCQEVLADGNMYWPVCNGNGKVMR